LRTAPAQSAMVHLIEREGYTSLVADVFTKESTIPETVNEVFRAFITMIELKHSTMEEIITYLMPDDFQTSTWDFEHASQITTDDTITETVDISEAANILVHGGFHLMNFIVNLFFRHCFWVHTHYNKKLNTRTFLKCNS
jgi:hypothetical protein